MEKKRILIPLLISIALLVLVATGVFILFGAGGKNEIAISLSKIGPLNIEKIYPTQIPDGYKLKEAATLKNGIVTYALSDDTNSQDGWFFSIQKLPSPELLDNFQNEQLTAATAANCPIGTAMVGTINARLTASIVTNDSWLIITAPLGSSHAEINTLISSLVLMDKQ